MVRYDLVGMIRAVLSPDLLKEEYRWMEGHPLAGHCYVASEAYYYLARIVYGDEPTVWQVTFGTIFFQGGTGKVRPEYRTSHWFLKDEDGKIIDITDAQFVKPQSVPYDKAKRKGFLTKGPSKRAWIVIDRVLDLKRRLDDDILHSR